MSHALDALAIANLKAAYCLAADTLCHNEAAARHMFEGMFTNDFVGDYGFGVLNGPDAIVDFMCNAIVGNSQWMLHMLGSPKISVEGNRAAGDWTIDVKSRRLNGNEMMTVVGRYSSIFRRTPGGWQIEAITFRRYE
jgi:SnoaL-like domain